MEENITNPNVDENEMVTAEPLLPLPKEMEHLKARENFIEEEGHGDKIRPDEYHSENFNNDVSTLQVSPYFKLFKCLIFSGDFIWYRYSRKM